MEEKELLAKGYVSKGGAFWEKDGKLFERNKTGRLIGVVTTPEKASVPPEEAGPEFRPGNELSRQEPFVEMDQMDEEQILAELRGEVLDQMVYVVGKGQNKIKSLSWAGVKTVALRQAAKDQPISIEEVKVDEKDDRYVAMALAQNLTTGEKRWGVAEQSKTMTIKDKDRPGQTHEVEDPFALPKVFSKAQRNAMRALLPEQAVAAMIHRWLEEQKGGNKRGT